MNIIEPNTPSGHTIFCDDIRQENNGKLILIGVYTGAIYINPGPPTTLAQLSLRIAYSERPGESTEKVVLKIWAPGETEDVELATIELPDSFRSTAPPKDSTPESSLFLTSFFHFKMNQLAIPREGTIRVRAYRGDTEIRLGAIWVKAMPIQEVSAEKPPAP